MKRPNAIYYLGLWGGITGWLSAAFMLLLLNITELAGKDAISASALFGGISGTVLGFVAGWVVHFLLANFSQGFEALRHEAEVSVLTATFLGMILLLFVFQVPVGISLLYVFVIPLMLMLGTQRYFKKLAPLQNSLQAVEKAKNQPKAEADENYPESHEAKKKTK